MLPGFHRVWPRILALYIPVSKAAFFLLSLALASRSAAQASYAVTYSGGTVLSGTAGAGTPGMVNGKWTVSSSDPNYTGSPGNWQGKIADAKVAGPITIHLTWNGSGDKPKSVILAITSTAIATGDLLQSVNDGIGDTASSGVSTGTHYFVVTDPGTSADYVVSGIAAEGKQSALSGGGSFAPIRGAAGIAPSGAQFATASIQLSASVVIPSMDVKGLTLNNNLRPPVYI